MPPESGPWPRNAPVGIFDSGVGGLSVWRAVRDRLPHESTVYLADQAHVPYGPRPVAEVRALAEAATRFLLAQGCKLVVVACNTASAAALQHLRANFPNTSFVGMEPAVKPAATHTRSGVVAVLATPGTLQGELFTQTSARFAQGVRLVNIACTGLVERIEAGDIDGPETRALLVRLLAPAVKAGADTAVLACTHFPFAAALIRQTLGDGAHIIDPAPAVARQLGRVLQDSGLQAAGSASHRFLTTGDTRHLAAALRRLLGLESPVEAVQWRDRMLNAVSA